LEINTTMPQLLLFNKPYGVLSQFTDRGVEAGDTDSPRETLSDYINIPDVYPAGRLDRDSEGLLLLTDDGKLQARISDPKYKMPKTYLVQVEGDVAEASLEQLRRGVRLKDGITRPAIAELFPAPDLWPRNPPVRFRKTVPDCWLKLIITEGRNRQVRRMTAAIGHPTLRLVRWGIGDWTIADILPGEMKPGLISQNT
jgi:23S rRNA pseudouridine2457 synthase